MFNSCLDSVLPEMGDCIDACGASLTVENDDVDWVQRMLDGKDDEKFAAENERYRPQDGEDLDNIASPAQGIHHVVRRRARRACIACHKRYIRRF